VVLKSMGDNLCYSYGQGGQVDYASDFQPGSLGSTPGWANG